MNIEDQLQGIFLKCGGIDEMQSSRALVVMGGVSDHPAGPKERQQGVHGGRPLPQQDILAANQLLQEPELRHPQEMLSQDELMVQEETVKNDEEMEPREPHPQALPYAVNLPIHVKQEIKFSDDAEQQETERKLMLEPAELQKKKKRKQRSPAKVTLHNWGNSAALWPEKGNVSQRSINM